MTQLVTASNIDTHWQEWLLSAQSFRYSTSSPSASPYTVRKEKDYWYGYRKVSGKLHKRYIGKSEDLTVAKLEEVASLLNIPPEPRQKLLVTESVTHTNSDEVARLQTQIERLQSELQNARGKCLA